jgi:quercetin dioxygenase-like cupin family protein
MEILRFGPGVRSPRATSGTTGVDEQTIWADPRARVTELSFAPRALIPPQSSPDRGLFIVVAGGGWVQVGDERSAINHGEAVELPPGVEHGAWTDGSHMRAILVEVPDDAVEAPYRRAAQSASGVQPARGQLAARDVRPEDHDPTEGEPW